MERIEAKSRGRVKTAVYIIIRLITAAVLGYSAARGQWENAVTCLMTLGLLMIPSLLERKMHIGLPAVMEKYRRFIRSYPCWTPRCTP